MDMDMTTQGFRAALLQQSSGHMYLDLQSQRQDLVCCGYQKDYDNKQTVKHTRITGNPTSQRDNGRGRTSDSSDPPRQTHQHRRTVLSLGGSPVVDLSVLNDPDPACLQKQPTGEKSQ